MPCEKNMNSLKKYVRPVANHFHGERNGSAFGMKSNTAAINAGKTKFAPEIHLRVRFIFSKSVNQYLVSIFKNTFDLIFDK